MKKGEALSSASPSVLSELPWVNVLTWGFTNKYKSIRPSHPSVTLHDSIKELSAEFQADSIAKASQALQPICGLHVLNGDQLWPAFVHGRFPAVDSSLQACNDNLAREIPCRKPAAKNFVCKIPCCKPAV
ncbi:hypothetical protein [Porphyromonas gingivalis]|uniref:hypothetical protein n=1 Tax=Porphyromonas gingivalis TaxID=837 RepID=UPI001B8C5137|nr:hypothetical protein [Porphyromonas gingivalis]QUI89875.1 hypothetical protein KDH82_01535 [Porphyromonas gingivalis]QUI91820.1 hypothetical protein KC155_01535 [Porphyromonas gingivalis]